MHNYPPPNALSATSSHQERLSPTPITVCAPPPLPPSPPLSLSPLTDAAALSANQNLRPPPPTLVNCYLRARGGGKGEGGRGFNNNGRTDRRTERQKEKETAADSDGNERAGSVETRKGSAAAAGEAGWKDRARRRCLIFSLSLQPPPRNFSLSPFPSLSSESPHRKKTKMPRVGGARKGKG